MESNPIGSSARGSILREKFFAHFVFWRHRRDLYMLAASCLYFLVCTYFVCLANSYADRVGTNNFVPHSQRYSAPDVVLDPLRHVYYANKWMKSFADILVFVAVALGLGYCVLQRELSCLFVRRYQVVAGTVYALRAPFVCLTVLPSPLLECVASPHPNIFLDAAMLLLQIRVACADVFFSGHTILFTTTMLTYCYFAPLWLSVPIVIYSLFGMFSLIMTTLHYTIDIMGGFLFTLSMWVLYHWGYRLEGLRGTWLGRFVAFWEADGPPGTGNWRLGKPRHLDSEAGGPAITTDIPLAPVAQTSSHREVVASDVGPTQSQGGPLADTVPAQLKDNSPTEPRTEPSQSVLAADLDLMQPQGALLAKPGPSNS